MGKKHKLARSYDGRHTHGKVDGEVEYVERLGPCPKCGGEISIGMANDPLNAGKRTRVVLHAIPFCAWYGETAPEIIERETRAQIPSLVN